MPIGEVGLTAIGIGADIASTAWQNRVQTRAAHEQMDFQQGMFAKRYQTQVEDLRKAGLNPMLAYGQSPGTAPQGSMPSLSKPDSGRMFNESRVASAQEANIRADTNVKIENANLIKEEVELTRATAEMNKNRVIEIQNNIHVLEQKVENMRAEWLKDTSDSKLKDALKSSQQWLHRLYEQEERLLMQKVAIEDPKARAAKTTGAFAAHGENISRGLQPLSDFLPFGRRKLDYDETTFEDYEKGKYGSKKTTTKSRRSR